MKVLFLGVLPALIFRKYSDVSKNRPFRVYCLGQAISLFGSGIQAVALAWLTWRMLKSPLALGALAATGSLTLLLFSYLGGQLADRFDRRRYLILLETLSFLQAIALVAMQFCHAFSLALVLTLSLFGGVLMALEFSARQTFTSDLVGRANLVSGRALYSAIYSSSLAFGAAGASCITWLGGGNGEMYCFLGNAISYLFSLYTFSLISSQPAQIAQKASLVECLKYACTNRLICATLVQTAVLAMFGTRIFPLLPMFADGVLHSGAFGHGILRVAWATGSILGALAIGGMLTQAHLITWATRAMLMLPILVALLAVCQWLMLSTLLLGALAYIIYGHVNSCQSILQLETAPQLQGRMLAIRAMLVAAIDFVAALAVSAAADLWGLQNTMYACAILSFALLPSVWSAVRMAFRYCISFAGQSFTRRHLFGRYL